MLGGVGCLFVLVLPRSVQERRHLHSSLKILKVHIVTVDVGSYESGVFIASKKKNPHVCGHMPKHTSTCTAHTHAVQVSTSLHYCVVEMNLI